MNNELARALVFIGHWEQPEFKLPISAIPWPVRDVSDARRIRELEESNQAYKEEITRLHAVIKQKQRLLDDVQGVSSGSLV